MIRTSPALAFLAAAVALWLAAACSGSGGSTDDGSPDPETRPYSGPVWFDPAGFAKKTPPEPGDWLATYDESGRGFAAYGRSRPPRATRTRRVLALQPLGAFRDEDRAVLRVAADFASLYFQSPVRIESDAGLPRKDRRRRRSQSGTGTYWQYRSEWILRILERRLPSDAVALLGVTMEDLYPDPDWNYVFGEASLDRRVGVYSLARYQQTFWGKLETRAGRRLALLRTCKVLAHETAHMFGLVHCIRYECVVNGSNHLEEADRAPLYLCPDCLRKLAWNRGFDIAARYRALARFYREHGLVPEAEFVEGRLARADAEAPSAAVPASESLSGTPRSAPASSPPPPR